MPRALTWNYTQPGFKPKIQMFSLYVSCIDSKPCWTSVVCPVDFTAEELKIYPDGSPGCSKYNDVCREYAAKLGVPFILNMFVGMTYSGPPLSDIELLALPSFFELK